MIVQKILIGLWFQSYKSMNTVALYIKDFQKGTEISDRLIAMDLNIEFIEQHNQFSNNYVLAIVDLNDEVFGQNDFIKELRSNAQSFIIGYIEKVIKDVHDVYKSSGCDLILSNASLLKNIDTLVSEILNNSKTS